MWIVKYITDHYGTKIHRKEIHVHIPSILHALHVVLVDAGLQWPIFNTLFLTLKKAHTMYVS
jgi:hypothetical protein